MYKGRATPLGHFWDDFTGVRGSAVSVKNEGGQRRGGESLRVCLLAFVEEYTGYAGGFSTSEIQSAVTGVFLGTCILVWLRARFEPCPSKRTREEAHTGS